MEKTIVVLHNEEPKAGTWEISKGFDIEHRALRRLIVRYQTEFEGMGVIATRLQKPKEQGGRPVNEFLLNEEQAMYVGTLLTNTDKVRAFKRKLIKEFIRQRSLLLSLAARSQNAQWLEHRNAGKISRRQETDVIKEFIEYATVQGSKNAAFYYANISKMENRALFFLEQKFKNLRDILDIRQLSTIDSADHIVAKALRDGMDSGMAYQNIYAMAKKRVEAFAELRGKTFIPYESVKLLA
jgi:phage regulator Rha-like protein